VRDESSVSNADVTVIPSQFKVTKQILLHWQSFRDLKLKYVGSRQTEQLSFRSQQCIVSTVEESVLKSEMTVLESQEEDAPKSDIFLHVYGRSDPSDCGESAPHSGVKKAHDWMVDQLADLFRTTYKVKTQQVVKSRGQYCGDIELVGYLVNESGPVSLVLDLRISHDRVGSSIDPNLNGHLKYPNNLDQSLNDPASDKIRKYRADYNNRPPSVVSFMPPIDSTSGRLHSEFVRLLFLQTHRETDRFFAVSGVQLAQPNRGLFHFLRSTFSAHLKAKVGSTLAKAADLRINLNIDGVPIASRTHTHPSHSQSSHRHSYIGLVFKLALALWINNKQQVFARRVNPSALALAFSLSSHRQSYINLLFISRF
jgi:hypothetical protein